MAQQRISSTFTFDEELFKEYLQAKDNAMNKRDSLFYAIVVGVVVFFWFVGLYFVGSLTIPGAIIGVVVLGAFAFNIYVAITGRTIFWPRSAWNKTFQRFFTRHGVDSSEQRPWSFTCKTTALPNHVEVSVVKEGADALSISKVYKEFSHVEVTEHLVVLVSASTVGPVWKNLFSPDYADLLMKREESEDAIWVKDSLKGMDADELVEYLSRKVRIREG